MEFFLIQYSSKYGTLYWEKFKFIIIPTNSLKRIMFLNLEIYLFYYQICKKIYNTHPHTLKKKSHIKVCLKFAQVPLCRLDTYWNNILWSNKIKISSYLSLNWHKFGWRTTRIQVLSQLWSMEVEMLYGHFTSQG